MADIFLICGKCGEIIKAPKMRKDTVPCPACRRVGLWDVAPDEPAKRPFITKLVRCIDPDGGRHCNHYHHDNGFCELGPDWECEYADVNGEE